MPHRSSFAPPAAANDTLPTPSRRATTMDAVGKTPGVVAVHDRSAVVKAFQQAGKTEVAQAVVFGGG